MKLISYGERFVPTSDALLIFYHIPKCGGTTLRRLLERQLRIKSISSINELEWINIHFLQKNGFTFISGHAAWGIHELFPKHTRAYYITMLRDPWKRAISQYQYWSKFLRAPKTFEKYLLTRPNYLISFLGNGSYDLAQKRLSQDFFLFGILEQFTEFMQLVQWAFDLEDVSYEVWNATGSHVLLDEYEEYYELFQEINHLDIQFYQWAKDLFAKRTARICKKGPFQTSSNKERETVHSVPNGNDPTYLIQLKKKKWWDIGESHILARHAEQQNDLAQAEFFFQTMFWRLRSVELREFYRRTNQKRKFCALMNTLLPEMERLQTIITADSSINRTIQVYNMFRNKCKKQNIQPDRKTELFVRAVLNMIALQHEPNPLKYVHPLHKIICYGASERFRAVYSTIKDYLPKCCQVFLIDSDQDKWGKTFLDLTVYAPGQIAAIKPDLAIITSCFEQEIYEILSTIRDQNKLSYPIFVTQAQDTHKLYLACQEHPLQIINYLKNVSDLPILSPAGHPPLQAHPYSSSEMQMTTSQRKNTLLTSPLTEKPQKNIA